MQGTVNFSRIENSANFLLAISFVLDVVLSSGGCWVTAANRSMFFQDVLCLREVFLEQCLTV